VSTLRQVAAAAAAAAAAASERLRGWWLLVWAPPSDRERKLERSEGRTRLYSFRGLHGPGRAVCNATTKVVFFIILNVGFFLKNNVGL
jgi:hypothetical protein